MFIMFLCWERHGRFHLEEPNESLLDSCNSETDFLKAEFGWETFGKEPLRRLRRRLHNIVRVGGDGIG
jgi:hypothetical protein